MILAGNQSKQRGPLHIYLKTEARWRSPATEFPSEICAILHDRHTDIGSIGACISFNFTPR